MLLPLLLLAVAVISITSGTQLVNCLDAGPWACEEDGCPSPMLGCAQLAEMGLCLQTFAAIWEHGAPQGTETATVHERCPSACGRCGWPAPGACNMQRVDALKLTPSELAAVLLKSESPVVVEGAMEGWLRDVESNYRGLLAEHARLPLNVITAGGRVRGEATTEQPIVLGDLWPAMRNGSLPGDSYVFYELGGVKTDGVGGDGFELAGVDVSDEARALARAVPQLRSWMGSVVRAQVAETPSANARLLLSAGSWGNGRPFHAHGPAMLAMLSGVKRWFIKRPNATFAWQTFELTRDSALKDSDDLPDGWADQIWQCSQRVGEMLWVPDLMHHATLNYGTDTTGLTLVMDDLTPLTALHEAAQSGSADDVRTLLASNSFNVDVKAGGGATPLHYAAGLGHCDAAEALLAGGAALHARASSGHTPLHLAVAAGREQAVELLLKHGAALDVADQHGMTPLRLARQLGDERAAIAKLLEDAAASSVSAGAAK